MRVFFWFLLFVLSAKFNAQQNSNDIPKDKIIELKNFIQDKDVAIFINYKIHSGNYRYFIYDLKNDKILHKAMIAHGSGSAIPNSKKLQFSDKEGSYQSSLGKFVVNESYFGDFGKTYQLDGLDFTNNQARKRAIVLHSFDSILDTEIDNLVNLSLGCPMISQKSLDITAKYINQSSKRMILHAFY